MKVPARVRPQPDGPLTHISRSTVAWRDPILTECGRPIGDVHEALTREQFNERYAREGQKRMSLITCVTCWETATRHPTWEENPMAAMSRETGSYWSKEGREPITTELKAIAILIARHRAEFDELLTDHRETVPLPVGARRRP